MHGFLMRYETLFGIFRVFFYFLSRFTCFSQFKCKTKINLTAIRIYRQKQKLYGIILKEHLERKIASGALILTLPTKQKRTPVRLSLSLM
jgi:hypothetical protein